MAELPQNWIECELEKVVKLASGGTPKSDNKEYYKGGTIPWLIIADLNDGYIEKAKTSITELGLKESSAKIVPLGAILIAMYGSIGKLGIANIRCATNQAIAFTEEISPNLNSKYLFYYFFSIKSYLASLGKGGAQQNISQTVLKKVPIYVPPLNEQKRIVKKLDSIMPKVDEVNERLERIPLILKQARQSILNQAITGELTKDWRKNQDKETLALFSKQDIEDAKIRYYNQLCLKAIENNMPKPKFPKETKVSDKKIGELPDLPDDWNYYRLFDISNLVTDGTHKTPKYVDFGIPFLSVKNVRPFKIFDTDIKYITPEESKTINLRCNPEKGDILYTKVGATYGFATKINLDYKFSIFVSLALIKPVKQYFTSDYAEIVLNSDLIFNQAREKISGIAVPDLHLIEIKDFRIPLPSVEEQTEIVKRVKEAFEKLDKIEEQYKKAKSYTDKLTQSILHKAFNGDLVPQDPNDKPVKLPE